MRATIDPQKDYYQVLGVTQDASIEEIKAAFRALARRYHPDSATGDAEQFRLVQEAYDVLRDPAQRLAYDRQRASLGLSSDAPLQIKSWVSASVLPALESEQLLYVMAEISPKSAQGTGEQPLNLALVIDRSTSMRGTRMENVKLAIHEFIDALKPEDRLAVIAFSDRAEVIVPSVRGTEKRRLHAAISRLVPSGGTEIYQGLMTALEEVRRYVGGRYVSHVILMTDGRTYGDEELSLIEAKRAAAQGIGISALGIGEDWNDLFLDALAQAGHGLSQYISAPSQLQRLLQQHLRGLSSVIARNLDLFVKPAEGMVLRSIYRVRPHIGPLPLPEGGAIALGHLSDESIGVLLELVVQPEPPLGEHRILRFEVEALCGNDLKRTRLRHDVKVTFTTGEVPPQEVPARLLNTLARWSVYRLQEKAWRFLEKGDTREATTLLQSAATRLFDMGQRELARVAMLEADRIDQQGAPSSRGRKQLRYGTRSLAISPADDKLRS